MKSWSLYTIRNYTWLSSTTICDYIFIQSFENADRWRFVCLWISLFWLDKNQIDLTSFNSIWSDFVQFNLTWLNWIKMMWIKLYWMWMMIFSNIRMISFQPLACHDQSAGCLHGMLLWLSICLSPSLYVSIHACLFDCLSSHLFVCMFVFKSIYQFVCRLYFCLPLFVISSR